MIYGVSRYWGIVTRIEKWPDADKKAATVWADNRSGLGSRTARTLHYLLEDPDIDGVDLEIAVLDIEKAATSIDEKDK